MLQHGYTFGMSGLLEYWGPIYPWYIYNAFNACGPPIHHGYAPYPGAWSCIQSLHKWKLQQVSYRTHSIWWVEADCGQCRWPIMVLYVWRACSLVYTNVGWRYTIDIHRILITHTIACAMCIQRIHCHTHCFPWLEDVRAQCKWPNVILISYVYSTYYQPSVHEATPWIFAVSWSSTNYCAQ
jgi:hypothetical protein